MKNEILENVENCNEKQFHYISAPSGLFAVFTKETGQTDKLQYIHTDHLGSIQTISNESGQIEATYSYDAWGRQRDATDWSLYTVTPLQAFSRGYTGHEHLSDYGLINMNGRLYDPVLGRMLSPDNYVPMPGNSQSYNRYSYAYNNPLIYTDPDGNFPIPIIIPMLIGAYTNYVVQDMQGNVNNVGDVAMSAGVGAFSGVLYHQIPLKIPYGENSFLKLAPHIAGGTDGLGLGVNATFGYDIGIVNAGANFGLSYYYSATGTGASGFEGRIGYGIGYERNHFQGGIGSTYFFSGETSQLSGQMYIGGGKWKVTYENDTYALVPGLWDFKGATYERDKFRTVAMRFDITGGKFKGANAGFNIFTGETNGRQDSYGNYREPGERYRFGAIYAGYRNYRIGYNSERNIRGSIQNGFHGLDFPLIGLPVPPFKVLNNSDRFYGGYYSSNPYTLW